MGALVTKALRPIKAFNIENRAHRVISKEKPVPAPKFQSNVEDLKRVLEKEPNIDEILDMKDPALDNRLKDVYVTSHGRPEADVTKEIITNNPNRPLPQNKNAVEDFEFGYKVPDKVPYGHTTLRDVINYISAHQIKPEEVTASKIAFEYKLKEEDVENILKYFKTYEIYIPETKHAPATFAGPVNLRKQLYNIQVKELDGQSSVNSNVDSSVPETEGNQNPISAFFSKMRTKKEN